MRVLDGAGPAGDAGPMATIAGITIAVTAVVNAFFAIADLARARFVLANSTAVRVPPSWLPMLGAAKGAGAVGLVLALFGVPVVGPAAATGLVLFFVGAVVAHVRARVFHTIAFPAGLLALAAGALAGTLAT